MLRHVTPLCSLTPPPAEDNFVVSWQDYDRHQSEYDQQQDSQRIAQLAHECLFLSLGCHSALFFQNPCSLLRFQSPPLPVAGPSTPLVQPPVLSAGLLSPPGPLQAQLGLSLSYPPGSSSCYDSPSLGVGQVWPIPAVQHILQAQVTPEQFMAVQRRSHGVRL